LPVPINRTTINRLYGLDLDERGVGEFLARAREPRSRLETSEDVVLASVGRDLCEKFFRGYTRKHWGLDLSELAAGVAARVPVRTNDDDRYFSDTYQCMPKDGYSAMFRRMLEHPLITFETGVELDAVRDTIPHRHLIYTGPIDAYFDYRYGRLPYRSIEFRHEHVPGQQTFQAVGTVNHPNDGEYTRVTEFKHLTGQVHSGTSIVREYPRGDGEPFYPIPRKENEALFRKYRTIAGASGGVTFVGRLAQYRYYDMDQVVGAALTAAVRVSTLVGRPELRSTQMRR
ncbi:MAG TPA: UDP-galactopyranose mutase, partial [Casimicrobiaceae bacterium]|nr:UDP-galactopyranose mutase [Casimicrobiaceae bacterium]